jgi:hypothetical protein
MRQPSITRTAASLIAARVVGSNKMLLCVGVKKFYCNIIGAVTRVNFVRLGQGAEPKAYYFAFVTAQPLQKMSGLTLSYHCFTRKTRVLCGALAIVVSGMAVALIRAAKE